jgi:hypothetical protein
MAEPLAAVVPRKTAETIWRHFHISKVTHSIAQPVASSNLHVQNRAI